MSSTRLAAIDIGTNSIRSVIVEADAAGTFRVLDEDKATVRLGEGLSETGTLSQAACERAYSALQRQRKILDGYQVESVDAIATSAVRKAANGAEFIAGIKECCGIDVSVISGDEEAELVALSAFNNFDMAGNRHLLADIGGGSLELVSTIGRHMEEIFSLDLGAVYLSESFLKDESPAKDSFNALRRHIRKTLKAAFAGELLNIAAIIGSGGTITSIATMIRAERKEKYSSVHGYELRRSDIVHLLAMLQRKSRDELRALPGLSPDRADIIVAGVVVIDELMEFSRSNLLKVNERGIREGMVLKSLKKLGLLPAEEAALGWRESALAFADACRTDKGHALQVARLSLEIFDTLARHFKLGKNERRLLEAAAILHDVGYFINYSSHHKHSYHLIRHAGLFGFNPREREMIAQIARYHRRSIPKKKHEPYMKLSSEDRIRVSRLGGILRLADGLDRSRVCRIQIVEPRLSPSQLSLRLKSDQDISVEIYGASSKSDLFSLSFGLELKLEPSCSV